ncbi:MAG TPA: pyrrolo-quinoline quinone [Planctomycetaceae bacterium]|nr:pyrrolo-quinoline quinone [Planctomycetaceae bacterium]
MQLTRLMLLPILASLSLADCLAENYPQFRGANGDAVSEKPLPVSWSDVDGKQQNIRWKITLEGEGWSQPIVWEDKLIFTAAIPLNSSDREKARPESNNGGYGRDRRDLIRLPYRYQVICLNAPTGGELWRTTVKEGKPPIPRHSTNTYATETPATDGERVYAYFGMNGIHCLDMDGELVWQKELGVYEMRADWGTASSPVLYDDKVFLQIDNQEQSFMVALNKFTGQEEWRIKRDEASQYSSPFIWKNSLRTELIVGGMFFRSHDPATGELLWEIDMNKGRASATPVAIGDRLYIGNEFRNRGGADDGGGRLLSIVPGGSGNITPAGNQTTGKFVEWRMDDSGIQMASPTHCGGKLYFFERRRGVVSCVDAKSGRLEYKKRVNKATAFWASPWTDTNYLFALDATGNTHVIQPGPDFKVVSVNRLDQQAWGTPAISNGRIFLRTVDHLYCIAQ